jgi:hypothetical protein
MSHSFQQGSGEAFSSQSVSEEAISKEATNEKLIALFKYQGNPA